MYRLLFVLVFSAISFSGFTQSKDIKTKALNNYIDFTNDCIHGLTISHLMLQSFNNEVNKYVDATDGFVFKNSDFGRDIYSELSYYEHRGKSPKEQYPIMIKEGGVLGADAKILNELTTQIFDAAKRLNELRFSAGDFLEKNDIQNPDNLGAIYKKLEEGVKLFDQIYSLRNELDRVVNNMATKRALSNQKAKYDKIKGVHVSMIRLLQKIRAKETVDFKTYMLKNVTATQALKTLGSKNAAINDIYTQAVAASKKANQFYTDGSVPPDKIRYGKFYHYYNSIITSYLNTVGSGTAFKSNKFLESQDINQVKFLELPPIFKVLYPRKLVSSDVIVSTDSFIEAIPEKLKEREITSSDHTIIVDSQIFELELSDQKLLDGDIVSVSYNGDWILENKSLEKEPVKLKVQLNDRGKNFFTLHAVNEGVVSPNTMEVAYFYQGKKKRVLMESNMKTSQLIEVILE